MTRSLVYNIVERCYWWGLQRYRTCKLWLGEYDGNVTQGIQSYQVFLVDSLVRVHMIEDERLIQTSSIRSLVI